MKKKLARLFPRHRKGPTPDQLWELVRALWLLGVQHEEAGNLNTGVAYQHAAERLQHLIEENT